MSLINQMLSDLDRREGRSATPENSVPEPVPVAGERRPTRRYLLWGGGGVALILVLSLFLWGGDWNAPPAAEKEAQQPKPVERQVPATGVAEQMLPEQMQSAVTPVPDAPQGADTAAVFEPTPPAQVAAEAGGREAATPTAEAVVRDSKADTEPTGEAQADSVKIAQRQAAPESGPGEESLEPIEPLLDAGPGPSSRFTLSKPVKRAAAGSESSYIRAQRYLGEGRLAEAESALRETLKGAPNNHKARELLVGLLVRGGRGAEALQLLREGTALAPHRPGFALLQARILMQQGDNSGAVGLLEEVLQSGSANREVVSLLAVIYQQQKRHERALELYRMLIEREPGLASNWVGAAISLEALSNPDEALSAYRRAVNSPNLAQALRAYAKDRIKILGQN